VRNDGNLGKAVNFFLFFGKKIFLRPYLGTDTAPSVSSYSFSQAFGSEDTKEHSESGLQEIISASES
jgi:hypothetical protein